LSHSAPVFKRPPSQGSNGNVERFESLHFGVFCRSHITHLKPEFPTEPAVPNLPIKEPGVAPVMAAI